MQMDRDAPVAGAKSQRGFTLIELMVVVAVLAILATIAVPTYQRYVTSTRRADGRAALTALALAQERHFSVFQRYTDDFEELRDKAGLDPTMVTGKAAGVSEKGNYSLQVTPTSVTAGIARGFLGTATRTPSGADPDCSAMTINSAGVKGGTPATNKCW
jgi:type IV pilus assembly protein PilE